MICFANCKVNLGLNVLRKRPDGYHDIETAMLPVRGFYDTVEVVKSSGDGVVLSSSGLVVDCPPENNLCVKAYDLVREKYDIGGVKMHLHKVVPFGAGLGGGSSDAVAVIKLLDRVFSIGMKTDEMEALAAGLGSDTVFFVKDIPALAKGRGEVLEPVDIDLRGCYIAILKPPFPISTSQAYSGVVPAAPQTSIADILAAGIGSWKNNLRNDFEPSVFGLFPELARIKEELYGLGAVYASMSGSGSAVYGIFREKPVLKEGLFSAGVFEL